MIVEMHASPRLATVRAEREVADLYRAHYGYVWQVLQKLGVEAESLEDAAHDVFVVAHRRWGDFEGRSSARTWLFAVARRLAHRYRRADFRRRRRRAALALVPQPAVIEPDAALQRREAWHVLLAFLDELDPMHREVFLLGELEGHSRVEMGRALGISPNTAYSRLRAARRRFAETFPDPQRREHVRRASEAPSPSVLRRGRALLVAHFAASRTTIAGGALRAAGSVGLLATAIVATAVWAPPLWTNESGGDRTAATVVSSTSHTASRRIPADAPEVPVTPPDQRPGETQTAHRTSIPDATRETSGRFDGLGGAPPQDASVAEGSRRRAAAFPTSSPTPEPTPATSSLADLDPAMAELAKARLALREHRPDQALLLLDRSRRLDIAGAFAPERAMTRIWALCATGRTQAASSELRRLQRSGNAVAYEDVLAGSCVADMITSPPGGDQGG